MRIIEVEKKPLFFEEEKLSPEEKKYRSAVALMESVDCVTRFETAVDSQNSAAVLFESLGDYKDSRERAIKCKKKAVDIREKGMENAYRETVAMQEAAKSAIDYRTVISEFERFGEYKDSTERIALCQKAIKRLANLQAWKNRGVVVLVLAAFALIFWISPAKPYTKGIIRMKQEHYATAIKNFKQSGNFLNADNMKKKCRYQQALKAYAAGNEERAMMLCRLANGRADADELLTRLEIKRLREAKQGDRVLFGSRTWQVLRTDGKQCTLLQIGIFRQQIFAKKTNNWPDAYLRKWLNQTYKSKVLNQKERLLLQQICNDSKGEKMDKLYLLSYEEYEHYREQLPAQVMVPKTQTGNQDNPLTEDEEWETGDWWLRSAGSDSAKACYVDSQGVEHPDGDITQKMGVVPVIQILLDETLLEK